MINVNELFGTLSDFQTLSIDKIIVEEKLPILFSCTDLKNNVYIAVCCGMNANRIMWYISKTTYGTLIDLLTNKITIYDSIKNGNDCKYIVTYDNNGIHCESVPFDDLDEDFLPVKGEYLDAEDDEFAKEISEFEARMDSISYSYSGCMKNFSVKTSLVNNYTHSYQENRSCNGFEGSIYSYVKCHAY